MLDVSTLPALVDELTELNTQIAVLVSRQDAIKADLAKTGLNEICGSVTRAVISRVAASQTTSWKDLAMSFKPTAEEIAPYLKTKDAYVRVEVKGYNARRAA